MAVCELFPRTIEFRDGEKSPRPCPNGCGGAAPDWNPYGVVLVFGGGHMPPLLGVNGGTELPLVTPDEIGLRPSAELLLGGVRRLPTLVKLVDEGVGCVELRLGKLWYFC